MAQKTLSVKVFGETWAKGRSTPLETVLSAEDRASMDLARSALTSPQDAWLTRRELEVLLLVAAGLSNTQIADRLVITPATIISYLNCIYKKLGVHSRTAAMRYAIDHHLCLISPKIVASAEEKAATDTCPALNAAGQAGLTRPGNGGVAARLGWPFQCRDR